MKTMAIYKARRSLITQRVIQNTEIIFANELPDLNALDKAVELYNKDAKDLADVLENTLPGGTFDRLVAELLIRKAGHLEISWAGVANTETIR